MAIKSIQDSRQLLRALENLSNASQDLEEKFADELHLFFNYLGRKIIENVDLEDPLSAVFYQQANGVIQEYWKEYDQILTHYIEKAARLGVAYHKILLSASQEYSKEFESLKSINPDDLKVTMDVWDSEDLFAPNQRVSYTLGKYTFEASQKTMAKVGKDINLILIMGYNTGWGHKEIAQRLQKRFTELSSYEARRIAQTEINSTRNMVQYNCLVEDEMEYKIWMEARDSRTRPTHRNEKGGVGHEIVPINEKFSNGLMYAGDKSGKISEWINCRCSIAAYIIPQGYEAPAFFPFREKDLVKAEEKPKPTDYTDGYEHPTIATGVDLNGHRLLEPMELLNMSFDDIAKHHDAKYMGIVEYAYDGRKYHTFEQTYDNGKTLTVWFEDKAVKSYTKKGWIHPNVLMDEVFKVPNPLKRNTDNIWFKDTSVGIVQERWSKRKYDNLPAGVGGYNQPKTLYSTGEFQHNIVINNRYFKGCTGMYKDIYEYGGTPYFGARNWQMTIHHEFSHSIDTSKASYDKQGYFGDSMRICFTDYYSNIHRAEPYFTWYANTQRSESFAEHCGYVSRMLANPNEHNLKIECKYKNKDGDIVDGKITFEEYKELYPKHYEFFVKLLTGELPDDYTDY